LLNKPSQKKISDKKKSNSNNGWGQQKYPDLKWTHRVWNDFDRCSHLNKRPGRKINNIIVNINGLLVVGMVDEGVKTLLNDNIQ
jgi:hypothetical protein